MKRAAVGIVIVAVIGICFYFVAAGRRNEKKTSLCGKQSVVVLHTLPTQKQQAEARKLASAQGSIAISINEAGDVVDAKVVQVSPPEAATLLLSYAKSIQFQERPGCGTLQRVVDYTFTATADSGRIETVVKSP